MSSFVAWAALLLGAVVSELIIKPRVRGAGEIAEGARASDQAMVLATVVAVAVPPLLLALTPWRETPAVAIAGLVLAIAGLVLRSVAMVVLAQRYQLTPREQPDAPTLVTRGPYANVRHPGYAGLVMFFLGTAAVFGDPGGIVAVFPMILFVHLRIRGEEVLLAREFSAEFAAYTARVRYRLLPRIY